MRKTALLVIATALLFPAGCVERELTIRSEPPGAMVYLDEEPMGYTPVTFPFYFYGYRTLKLQKSGFRTYEKVRHVKPPWWQWPVISIFADLQPFPLNDEQSFDVALEPIGEIPRAAILERGKELRDRVDKEIPLPEPAPAEPPAEEAPAEETPAQN